MITQYCLTLRPERPCVPRAEWGYQLYAALLEQAPQTFGTEVHRDAVTPLSQFLSIGKDAIVWRVHLLGETFEQSLSPLLQQQKMILLKKDMIPFRVTDLRTAHIRDAEELFALSAQQRGLHVLHFQTPTAFKSQKQYLNLPTSRLIIQSLIRKWNGSFPDCPIEDEDGSGMEAIAAGLCCRRFQLRDQTYYLKGNGIPGFVGSLTLENRLSGFQREFADALLFFSGYSGIGIKTALGMGGVQHQMQSGR